MAGATNGVTVPCTINRDVIGGTWVEVRNNLTGNSLVLDLNEKGMDQTRFRGEWAELWTLLGNVEDGDFIDLTPRQMQTFKAMVDYVPRSNAAKGESKTAVRETARHAIGAVAIGIDNAGERVRGFKTVIDAVKNDVYCVVQYDIPKTARPSQPAGEGINYEPTSVFWRNGFYMTESVAICPSKRIAGEEIQEVFCGWDRFNSHPERRGKRIKYRVLPFAEESMDEIREMAVEALDEYVRLLHGSLINRIGSADETLKNAHKILDEAEKANNSVTDKDRQEVERTRMNTVRALLKEKGRELNDVIASAELFDVTMEDTLAGDTSDTLGDLIRRLRKTINEQVAQFNVLAAKIGVKPAA